jgi:hypothetical protein
MRHTLIALGLLAGLGALAGCDKLGLDDPAKAAAAREAEGKAIGSGCRQSGRAIEDCYEMNPKQSKAAIFAGWREMDGYMRDNKMESAKPMPAEGEAAKPAAAGAETPATEKPAKSQPAKAAAKQPKP